MSVIRQFMCVALWLCSWLPCPEGHYCEKGTRTPTPCNPGTYNNNTGQSNITACLPCSSGQYCEGSVFQTGRAGRGYNSYTFGLFLWNLLEYNSPKHKTQSSYITFSKLFLIRILIDLATAQQFIKWHKFSD